MEFVLCVQIASQSATSLGWMLSWVSCLLALVGGRQWYHDVFHRVIELLLPATMEPITNSFPYPSVLNVRSGQSVRERLRPTKFLQSIPQKGENNWRSLKKLLIGIFRWVGSLFSSYRCQRIFGDALDNDRFLYLHIENLIC